MGEKAGAGFFEATIWSTVLKAKGAEGPERSAALERLLIRYRGPILKHIQASLASDRQGHAEDLTQEFIHQCLRLDFLKQVSPENGLFRTFVKKCVANFLRDQYVKEQAAKRGSGRALASLDETDGDGNRMFDPPSVTTLPDTALDREWALTVLKRAMNALQKECEVRRQGPLFEALKGHLDRAPDPGTAKDIGARLGMSEGAVHTAMSRLRGRLGELIREEVRQTVGTRDDWRVELKYLIELLGRG